MSIIGKEHIALVVVFNVRKALLFFMYSLWLSLQCLLVH